jgi:hypothetical protein
MKKKIAEQNVFIKNSTQILTDLNRLCGTLIKDADS